MRRGLSVQRCRRGGGLAVVTQEGHGYEAHDDSGEAGRGEPKAEGFKEARYEGRPDLSTPGLYASMSMTRPRRLGPPNRGHGVAVSRAGPWSLCLGVLEAVLCVPSGGVVVESLTE